mmetsp:Transcript_14541/g.27944  ORF Transcript_14541/g.27944 Transcript_14541/m.27944 type:complete len:306 (-) Transcript_14541:341-1258(-)
MSQKMSPSKSTKANDHDQVSKAEHLSTSPVCRFSLAPLRNTKVLHLVRHGEGFHNVAVRQAGGNHDLYKRWDFEDSQMTAFGWEQAFALKKHIQGSQAPITVDLVVVSPLSRTLQTAVAVFGGGAYESECSLAPPLMTSAAMEASGVSAPAAGIASDGCPPFVAHELCREMIGVHPCDKRRDLAYYKRNFPAVDFSLVDSEQDELWRADERETRPEIQARAVRFLQWVMTRSERHIAVVTHSAFLTRGLLPQFGQEFHQDVNKDMQEYVQNCEMRSMVLVDGNGGGGLRKDDPLWFAGGPHCVPR